MRSEIAAEWTDRQRFALGVTMRMAVAICLFMTLLDFVNREQNWSIIGLRVLGLVIYLGLAQAARSDLFPIIVVAASASPIAGIIGGIDIGRSGGADSLHFELVPVFLALSPGVLATPIRIALPMQVLGCATLLCGMVLGTHSGHTEMLIDRSKVVIIAASLGVLLAWVNDRYVTHNVSRRAAAHEESSRAAMGRERQRIARDLHDHIGAYLTGIALHAERARRRLPEAAAPTLRWIESSIHGCIEELRDTIWALSASERDASELLATLRRRAEDVASEAGFELRWQAEFSKWSGPLSSEISVALAAILREALTNVVRHSEASEVDVALFREDDTRSLEVRDNGRGLQTSNPAGRGLDNMRSRAVERQGTAEIENLAPAGVRVVARLPLAKEVSE